MRQGDKNGRTTGKDVGDRRPKAAKLCEIFSGGYSDYRHVRRAERVRYLRRFRDIRQKQERISVKRAGDRKHSLDIHEKTNEIPVFQEMLAYLDIEGKTVTADAMHCQRETCRRVIQRKGDYLFGLKENQPSFLEDVRLFFEGASTEDLDSFRTVEKNAGRIGRSSRCTGF